MAKKIIIVGLGNPILGDDGAGWRVAEQVKSQLIGRPDVQVECYALGGLSLMEQLTGYERVILIDSMNSQLKTPGSISTFSLNQLPDHTTGHMTAAHDTSLRNALNIGRQLNISLPEDGNIMVVAIEAEEVYDFSETLTPPVEAAVQQAVKIVLDMINNYKEK